MVTSYVFGIPQYRYSTAKTCPHIHANLSYLCAKVVSRRAYRTARKFDLNNPARYSVKVRPKKYDTHTHTYRHITFDDGCDDGNDEW